MQSPTSILAELRRRNAPLYWSGWVCWIGALVSFILIWTAKTQVSGLPAAIKPFKFFLSIAVAVWTLGWLMEHLSRRRAVRQYTRATVITMSIEMLIICGQAARGRMSHFNVTTVADVVLFQVMGIAIMTFTVWTIVIAWHFFRRHPAGLPAAYLWGIRLGMIAFVVFALEGGIMARLLRHTVGAADEPGGLPLLHWSTRYGDLRIAHFLGLHSLQVLPLAGYLLRNKTAPLFAFAALYIGSVLAILALSLRGLPVF